jgi:Hpt domain
VLDKPVPPAVLSDCVREALLEDAAAGRAAGPAGATPLPTPPSGAREAAITTDIAEGDAALARGDVAALHRLAHSLKTVLQLLGADAASWQARSLESAAPRRCWRRCGTACARPCRPRADGAPAAAGAPCRHNTAHIRLPPARGYMRPQAEPIQ